MSQLKEVLKALITDGALEADHETSLTEAYEFDIADYSEQLNSANAASGDANAQVAALTEQVSALTTDLNAVKAMNFDALMSGNAAGAAGADDGDSDEAGDEDNTNISLDELIEQNTKQKDAE